MALLQKMVKERLVKEDGRYLIYYRFEEMDKREDSSQCEMGDSSASEAKDGGKA